MPNVKKKNVQHKVVTNDARERVLFRGTEKDARKFVEDNFPRVHVEPGADYGDDGPPADVHMVTPDGVRHHYHGEEWSPVDGEDEENGLDAIPVDFNDDESDDERDED